MINDLNNKQQHFENNQEIKDIKKMIKDQKQKAESDDQKLDKLIGQMNPEQKKIFKFYRTKLNEARKELNTEKLMQVQTDFMKAMQKINHANTDTK